MLLHRLLSCCPSSRPRQKAPDPLRTVPPQSLLYSRLKETHLILEADILHHYCIFKPYCKRRDTHHGILTRFTPQGSHQGYTGGKHGHVQPERDPYPCDLG